MVLEMATSVFLNDAFVDKGEGKEQVKHKNIHNDLFDNTIQ